MMRLLIKSLVKQIISFPTWILLFIIVVLVRLRGKPNVPRLVWGPIPIISNKYWSNAMAKAGYNSKTIVYQHYGINERDDFDVHIDEFGLQSFPYVSRLFKPYIIFAYAVWNFDIFHHPISGGFLGSSPLWRSESFLLRVAGKKVIILPYGGDVYIYSRVFDPSLRHALLLSYPGAALREADIENRVQYWVKYADILAPFFQIDGIGRWDILPFSMVTIDTCSWRRSREYSSHDGISGPVNIVHAPNHRGFKGTEFLLAAVDELKFEGLKLNLILLEGISNSKVREILASQADILAEQFIVTAYALSGIEGMAVGLPVLSNLESENYTRVFRRYSYLNECPIVSTTPESIKSNLRVLIKNPALRKALGMAGREYVEKYHSIQAAQYIFNSIYAKIYHQKDIDLMNLFHPLQSDYVTTMKRVVHPLVESRIIVDRVML